METSYLTWFFLILVMILNIVMVFHDPLKYSISKKCLLLPCRQYSLILSLVTLTLDLMIGISLTYLNPIPFVPKIWFIPVGIIYLMVVLLHFNQSDIVFQDHSFKPPPETFFKKTTRIIFRSIILSLYLFILIGRIASETRPTLSTQPLAEKFIYNRFGGFSSQNYFIFFISWVTILTIPLAGIRLYQTITYHPTKYNQPLAWNQ